MNLVIDIGNTKAKVALFQSDELVRCTQYEQLGIEEVLNFVQNDSVNHFILSSVKEDDEVLYANLLKIWYGIKLTLNTPMPIDLSYYTDQTLGVDRLALVVAANKMYPNKASLVVSCGSCITYNLIDSSGLFLGGSISPGIYMRLKSMQEFTGKLPLAEWDGVSCPALLATSTYDSLLSGAINGASFEIDQVINSHKSTLKHELNIILSGGDAKFFEKELKNSIFAHANFVLYGLNEILQFNS